MVRHVAISDSNTQTDNNSKRTDAGLVGLQESKRLIKSRNFIFNTFIIQLRFYLPVGRTVSQEDMQDESSV
jgi:hypothetical protein